MDVKSFRVRRKWIQEGLNKLDIKRDFAYTESLTEGNYLQIKSEYQGRNAKATHITLSGQKVT